MASSTCKTQQEHNKHAREDKKSLKDNLLDHRVKQLRNEKESLSA